MRRLTAAFAIVLFTIASAVAQEDATPRATLEAAENSVTLTLAPFACTPEQHCIDIQLICTPEPTPHGSLEMRVRNLQDQHAERWMLGDNTATIYTDTAALTFTLQRLSEMEGWGLVARLNPNDDYAALLTTMPQSTEIDVVTPFYTFVVMPAAADAETMASFNQACSIAAPAAN
jgi:hypothetical protein